MTEHSATALFQPDRLTIGLGLPWVDSAEYQGAQEVDFHRQLDLAKRAEAAGFAALWVRDVPLNHPGYPESIGHLDPWVWLGALAAHTRRITLVTGAIVLTLRHPLHVAKAAASVSALAPGRFVLGLGSGDRPPEYHAFGRDTGAGKTSDSIGSGWLRPWNNRRTCCPIWWTNRPSISACARARTPPFRCWPWGRPARAWTGSRATP